ncbi:MAG: 4-carboxymuconolactone decarboxylase [Actinomycetota bacterium]|jgi:4-carboxymuconolactone decarboxylase
MQRDQLDADGRTLWDSMTESRGAGIVNADGGLVGPFNAWVTASDVGRRLVDLGGALRFRTSIDRRLTEVAIITTGARWKAEFEWWAHARMAREFGVTDEVVDAIGRADAAPPFPNDDERVVHAIATQLGADGRIDASTYEAGQKLLGDRGMVELVALCGYYTLVSFTLNAFEVALPNGVSPMWPS